MSVITYHEMSNQSGDIFDRLKSEGVIHEADIWSPKRREYVHFDNVFDYEKCDKSTSDENVKHHQERAERYAADVNSDANLSDDEKADKISNNAKCDTNLLPVYKSENGGVSWQLNYQSDDTPSVAISRRYPDEIFDYYQQTEGHLDVSCKCKNNKDCTPDGRPYEGLISHISNKNITSVNDNTYRVKLYIDSTDMRAAFMYVDKADVKPVDYTHTHSRHENYSDIVVRNKSDNFTLYRTLEDGTKAKESWSYGDLSNAIKASKREFREQMAERAVENVQEVENQNQMGE